MNTTPSTTQHNGQGLGTWDRIREALRREVALPLLLVLGGFLGGCAAVEGIFKAGLWVGIVVVLALVAVIGGAIALLRR